MQYILIILIVVLFTFLGYLFGKKKNQIKQTEIDKNFYNELSKLKEEKNNISNELVKIQAKKEIEENNLNAEIQSLQEKKSMMANNIIDLENQATSAADIFYTEKMEIAKARFEDSLEVEEKKYSDLIESYKNEYNKVLSDLLEEFKKIANKNNLEINELNNDIIKLQDKLLSLKQKINVIIESNKRAALAENEKNFYKCIITEKDSIEIKKLREIEPYFRDNRPICKIIWETYYRQPCAQLLERLLGKEKACGIYKITNLNNQKIYVGQSVNLQDRLTTHIKCGIGIDATNNKMYQDMKENGVETFMFEILERCNQNELNEKEKYWIDFYQGQSFGYNSTKGGS